MIARSWVAVVVLVAVAMLWSSTPAERAQAVHDDTWEPWATHVVTAAYDATITVTWTHDDTGVPKTLSCTLEQGYNDFGKKCVSGPLPDALSVWGRGAAPSEPGSVLWLGLGLARRGCPKLPTVS